MDFLLFVGTDHDLSDFEVKAQIPHLSLFGKGVYQFSSPCVDQAITITARLGSALKLAAFVSASGTDLSPFTHLIDSPNYSVTTLPRDKSLSFTIAGRIKELLGNKFRYIVAGDTYGLSPLIVTKQHVSEFFITSDAIFKTVWTHDHEHWIKKDRHLPFANAKAGILPPKIARILINLSGQNGDGKILLDPFCGSGRVLIEGFELGYKVIGSDISKDQINESRANLSSLQISTNPSTLFVSDATKLGNHLLPESVDLIVTEPFMGKPNIRLDRVPDMVKGLAKLYLGALKSWTKVLKTGGIVVMVFPRIVTASKTYLTSAVIDDPHLLGYNVKTRGVFYSKPGATVIREIVILTKS